MTQAVFVMVARDPMNQGSAIINPLIATNDDEKEILQLGDLNKLNRKLLQEESLFKIPPNETGELIKKLFEKGESFLHKFLDILTRK